jgi:hypothetical protein
MLVIESVAANGPGNKSAFCVGRREHRAESRYPAKAGPIKCHGARRPWCGFWSHGAEFSGLYACRGTSLIGAANLSPVTKLVEGTCAVSGYKAVKWPRNCQGERKVSRRGYAKYAAGGIVVIAVAGAGAFQGAEREWSFCTADRPGTQWYSVSHR